MVLVAYFCLLVSILAILVGRWWILKMLIICTNDVEELLICFLVNCVPSYVKYFLYILLIFNWII